MKKILIKLSLVIIVAIFSLGVYAQVPTTDDDYNIVFTQVEKDATFRGGIEEWKDFLAKNLNSKVPTKQKAPAGTYTVIIKFIVAKSGEVSDVVAETNLGYGMEAEVIRVIKKSPAWNPARQNGRMVNAYRRQPITFQVNSK